MLASAKLRKADFVHYRNYERHFSRGAEKPPSPAGIRPRFWV